MSLRNFFKKEIRKIQERITKTKPVIIAENKEEINYEQNKTNDKHLT